MIWKIGFQAAAAADQDKKDTAKCDKCTKRKTRRKEPFWRKTIPLSHFLGLVRMHSEYENRIYFYFLEVTADPEEDMCAPEAVLPIN